MNSPQSDRGRYQVDVEDMMIISYILACVQVLVLVVGFGFRLVDFLPYLPGGTDF